MTKEIFDENEIDIERSFDVNPLLEVGKWMDEDKGYKIGNEEDYNEFVRKRNETLHNSISR